MPTSHDLQDRECNADVSEVGISSEQQFSREVQETKLEKMKCKEEVRYWVTNLNSGCRKRDEIALIQSHMHQRSIGITLRAFIHWLCKRREYL